ncbi:hypothetical protein [Janthinobacterium aquaticum]|uniref:hypothetical protein n=1 Tax=Janthinobacterium sp. FT58W TaxID=2654254 RepID=UPI0012643737|nr:hypothetical protein [Janthinobacterium sp. FT58W]KAB8044243.1 hypothetical protein GCM43_03260 [Janthinobacterium sp. FT58W]
MKRRSMLVLLGAAMLAGCGVVDGTRSLLGLGPRPVAPDWQTLALRAAEDANANSAVAVDIVLVKDSTVLESLLAMPAAKWFATRSDVQRSFPNALTVFSYELVPGQSLALNDRLWRSEKVWGALVYAGYATPGEHRSRLLLSARGYMVQLDEQGFAATEIKPGAAQ